MTGFFGTKRIVVYDTLVTHLNGDVTDVCAVVAHEIGHAKLHHNYMMLLQASFQIFITFFTYGLCSSDPALVTDFGYEGACTYLKVQTFLTLYNSAVSPVLGPLNSAFTRALEFSVCAPGPRPVPLPCRPSASRGSLPTFTPRSHHIHTTFTRRLAVPVLHLSRVRSAPPASPMAACA